MNSTNLPKMALQMIYTFLFFYLFFIFLCVKEDLLMYTQYCCILNLELMGFLFLFLSQRG